MKRIFLGLFVFALSALFLSEAQAQTMQTRAALQLRYQTGDYPTQTDYYNVFETFFSRLEDTAYVSTLFQLDTLLNDPTLADSSTVALATQASIKAYVDATAGGVTVGDKGDIDVTSSGAIWTVDTSAINSVKILDESIAAADIDTGAVTTLEILDGTIASADFAAGAVDATALAATAVTAGTYGSASLVPVVTVDADGRLTSVSTAAVVTSTISTVSDTSGTDANNITRVTYKVVSSSPTVTVARAGEATASASVTISVSGGSIKLLEITDTYNNSSGSSCTVDFTMNGVGANEFDAIPVPVKLTYNTAATGASPVSSCQYDIDNTPGLMPYGYSSSGDGLIKVRSNNVPAGNKVMHRFMWTNK
jgi:hypothetical protein